MTEDTWRTLLISALAFNAAIGLGYRVHRLSKGGPMSDVIGQSILSALLVGIALAVSLGAGWPRWAALGYGLLFGLVVMPIWVLAVLIPLRPARIDYAFTATYWIALLVIVVAAFAA